VGFSSGDDPIFEAYKEHVGPFHLTPLEIFTQTFPDTDVKSNFGFDGYGCGLCQTKVPCESKIPTTKDVE